MSSTALVLALSAAAAAFAPPGGRLTPATGATVARSTAVPIYTDDAMIQHERAVKFLFPHIKTIEKRDDFLDVGFLLTDYASDFYDGKQITLCVYI